MVKLELGDYTYEWAPSTPDIWSCIRVENIGRAWESRTDLDCESLAEVGVTMQELIEGAT